MLAQEPLSLFHQAAELNNEGIRSLVEGKSTKGLDSLTNAIKLMKRELAQQKDDDSCASDDSSTSSSDDIGISTVKLPMSSLASGSYHHHDHSSSCLFDEVFLIPLSSSRRQDIHFYSAAIIFNLALAHHLIGTKSYQVKAEKLYSMILKLLGSSMMESRTAVLVKLASIHNLAQLRLDCGDYEKFSEGLTHVSQIMGNSVVESMIEDDAAIQGLLMNVLLLKAPKVAPAA